MVVGRRGGRQPAGALGGECEQSRGERVTVCSQRGLPVSAALRFLLLPML